MSEIELNISGRKYVVTAKDNKEHLAEVAEIVQSKIDEIRKNSPQITLTVASLLAAFDFASIALKDKKSGEAYRSTLLKKAHQVLEMVENEISENDRPVH